jgi:para-aminobenzoate synthetase component 1
MSYSGRNRFEEVNYSQIECLIKNSETCILLDNSLGRTTEGIAHSFKFSRLIGIGVEDEVFGSGLKSLSQLRKWLSEAEDYVFGYFSYELKNSLEDLKSSNQDSIGFYDFHFFIPETLVLQTEDELTVLSHSKKLDSKTFTTDEPIRSGTQIPTISESEYVLNIAQLKEYIQLGEIYEVNYCIQHAFENAIIDPYRLYSELQESSPAPFSCYVQNGGKHLMSSSPERFMKKTGAKLISQPMKGTNRRTNQNHVQKDALINDSKELAENVMITDLVRNDLSRSSQKGTVKVEELCGVYEFPHVNQMISTVSADLKETIHPLDALLNAFPMGSMTGAPKISAMKLIDEFEDFSRGLYSGSVGYFTPDLDFDFNVVIRSLLYNKERRTLTLPTGGAITINSDPKKEYEECLLKAEAMRNVVLNHAK